MNLFYSYLNFFSCIIYLALAIYVLVKNHRAVINRICGVLGFLFFIWSLSSTFIFNPLVPREIAVLFYNIASLGWILLVPFTFWFLLEFAQKETFFGIRISYVLVILFAIALVLIYIQFTEGTGILEEKSSYGWVIFLKKTIWNYFFYIYYISTFLYSIGVVLKQRLTTRDTIKKRQSEIIFITALISFITTTLSNIVLLNLGILDLPPLGNVFILIWVIGMVVAITKYKLFAITPITAAENIIATMNDALMLINQDGTVIIVNKAAENLFKYDKSELAGQKMDKLLEDPANLSTIIDPHADKKEYDKELVCITKNEKKIITYLSRSKLYDNNKKLAGFVCIFTDITHQKRTQEELLKIRKLESTGMLAGGIAHDFNNLLMVIAGGWSYLKLKAKLNKQNTKISQNIDKALQQAQMLIGQLIIFSKGGEPIRKLTSVSKIVQEVTEFVLSGSNILPVFSFHKSLWKVKVDKIQISRVIQNIVINSKQAMPKGGKILIGCTNRIIKKTDKILLKPGSYIEISIKDEGCGIPEENINNIFDPYFSTKDMSSGLGLTIAYSIIKKHEGYIHVDSSEGNGSTFLIYIPAEINRQTASVTKSILPKSAQDELKKLRILIMDDEKMILDNTQVFGKELGHWISIAHNGEEAIEQYHTAYKKKRIFDVVILDLTMRGGMGGYDTLKQLKKIDSDIYAIVSSGYFDNPVMSHYQDYGFKDVLPKPYTLEDFKKVLLRVIRN